MSTPSDGSPKTSLKHHEQQDSEDCWVSWSGEEQDGMGFVTVDVEEPENEPVKKPVIPLAPPVPAHLLKTRKPQLPPRELGRITGVLVSNPMHHVKLVEDDIIEDPMDHAVPGKPPSVKRAQTDPSFLSRPNGPNSPPRMPPIHSRAASKETMNMTSRGTDETGCWAWCGHCCPWSSPKSQRL